MTADTTQTNTPKLEAIDIAGTVYRPETFAGYLARTLETSNQKPSEFPIEFIEIDDEQNLNVDYIKQSFKKRLIPYVFIKFQNQNFWYANGQLFKDQPINNPDLLKEIDLYKKELDEAKRIRREVDEYATLPNISHTNKKYSTVYTELQHLEEQTAKKPKPETFGEKFNAQFEKKADRGELFNEFPFIETLTPFIEFLEELIKEGKSEAVINEHVLDFTFQYLLDEKNGKLKKEIVLALQKINSEINYDDPAVIYDIIKSFFAQILYGQLVVKINVPNSSANTKVKELALTGDFRALIKFLPYIVNSLPKFSCYFETIYSQFNQASSSSSSQFAQKISFEEFLNSLSRSNISTTKLPEKIDYIINKIKGTIDGIVNNTEEELGSKLEILSRYVVDFAQNYLKSPNGYKLSKEIKTWLSSMISDADKIDFDNPDVVNQVISAFISHTTQLVKARLAESTHDKELEKKQTILERVRDDAIEIADDICDAEKNKKIPNYMKNKDDAVTPEKGTRLTTDSDKLKDTENPFFAQHRLTDWSLPANFHDQTYYYYPGLTNDTALPDKKTDHEIFLDYKDSETPPYIFYKARWADGTTHSGKLFEVEFENKENLKEINKNLCILSNLDLNEIEKLKSIADSVSPTIQEIALNKIQAFSIFSEDDINFLQTKTNLTSFEKIKSKDVKNETFSKDEILQIQTELQKNTHWRAGSILSRLLENLSYKKLVFTHTEIANIKQALSQLNDDDDARAILEKIKCTQINIPKCYNDVGRILSDRTHIQQKNDNLEKDAPRGSINIAAEPLKDANDLDQLLIQNEFTPEEAGLIKAAYSAQLSFPMQSGLNDKKYFFTSHQAYAIQNIYKFSNGEIYLDLYADSFKFADLEKFPHSQMYPDQQFKLPGQIKAHYKLERPTTKNFARPRFKLEWYEPSNSLLKEISLGNGNVEITEDKLKEATREEEENEKKLKKNDKEERPTKNYLQGKKANISDKLKLAHQHIKFILNANHNILEKNSRPLYNATLTKLQNLIDVLGGTSSKRLDNFLNRLDEELSETFKHINDAITDHGIGEKEKDELRTLKNILDSLKDAPRRDIQQKITHILTQHNRNIVNEVNSIIPKTSSLLDSYNANNENKFEDAKSLLSRQLTDFDLINYYLQVFAGKIPTKNSSLSLRKSSPNSIDGENSEETPPPSPALPTRKEQSPPASSASTATTNQKPSVVPWGEMKSHILDWYTTYWNEPKESPLPSLPIPMDDLVILKEAITYQEALTWEDAEVCAFQHALKISNAIQYFKAKLVNKDRLNPNLIKFYTNIMTELRKTYGEINSYLYFNSKLSNLADDTNPSNILDKFIDQKISGDENKSPEALFNLANFIDKLKDESFITKPKMSEVGFFGWLAWYFNDLNELKENVHATLMQKTDSPLDKITNIRKAAETMVLWWTFKETDSQYYTVAFKAELSCLLADFTDGHMDEPALLQTLNNMQNYYQGKLVKDDAGLLNHLKDFTTTFTNAYIENENNFSRKVPDAKDKYTLQNREINRTQRLIDSYTKIADRYHKASFDEWKQRLTPEREQEYKTRMRIDKRIKDFEDHIGNLKNTTTVKKTNGAQSTDDKKQTLVDLQLKGPRTRF